MSRAWDDFTIWLESLWLRWKHRNDTPEQTRERLRKATAEIRGVLSDMPADKFVHGAYELCEKLERSASGAEKGKVGR